MMKNRSFSGKGKIHLRNRKGTGGLMPIGNCSALEVSFEEEKKTQKDYTTESGGNANVISTISAMTGNMTMLDYSAENMSLALRGSVNYNAAATVTDETQNSSADDGRLIKFDFIPDRSEAITVKKNNDSPLTQDADYTISPAGIVVIGAGAIDDTGVKVSYTKSPSEVLEALTSVGDEYELVLDGLNEAQSGSAVVVVMHRIKFSPGSGIAFITDDYGELPIEFEVLSDSTVVGSGLSKFMKIDQAI